MRAPHVLAREAAAEFRAGLASGIAPLVFAGLTAYLLLVLSSAGYLRDMNAADVPRNAPMLVYLMTPGMSFFLFFAWAWVFGQCVARERQAQLHEVVLAAPVPLAALLAGRWLGAWGVALLLGASQAVGFMVRRCWRRRGWCPRAAWGPRPGRPSPGAGSFTSCRCRPAAARCTCWLRCARAAWPGRSPWRRCCAWRG